ncbi:hypothetical protein I5Q34_34075 [Streptomyces sp. AV19]|uniref:DUF6409 family protein n=1 Tax=Streptomyces sp. AV19 TaxID=2793068 RepID=UPI0018FE952B|nr:DUF6409 family protein [Streptomyces sp. AV19]MBH1939229.1 hypothetical protein [Streptomyces sp. AV19]MDG4537189.1 DUF6409 family protein [Streptomyces sp. AV19]
MTTRPAPALEDLRAGTLVHTEPHPRFPTIPAGRAVVLDGYTTEMVVVWHWTLGPIVPGRTAHAMFRSELTILGETLGDLPLATLGTMRTHVEAFADGDQVSHHVRQLRALLQHHTTPVCDDAGYRLRKQLEAHGYVVRYEGWSHGDESLVVQLPGGAEVWITGPDIHLGHCPWADPEEWTGWILDYHPQGWDTDPDDVASVHYSGGYIDEDHTFEDETAAVLAALAETAKTPPTP